MRVGVPAPDNSNVTVEQRLRAAAFGPTTSTDRLDEQMPIPVVNYHRKPSGAERVVAP